ncbi:hypothetical protein HPB50_016287 [Hyalomma asiaticum]|uniref:Uncharacterized protein n=1 Tax=Hyalomma asiaticum TaxID=266040 RepID=A0ACB7RV66_HYAAI|nr:hypothetical protein HPB50_016287 [Hyalomma asiaticum]
MPLPELFVAVPDQSATEGTTPASAEVPCGYLDGHAAAGGDWLSTPPSSPLVSTLPPHGYIGAIYIVSHRRTISILRFLARSRHHQVRRTLKPH